MEALVAQVEYQKIKYDGIHCSQNCTHLENGLCNIFGRELNEPKSNGFPKTRLNACIEAETLAKRLITEMVSD